MRVLVMMGSMCQRATRATLNACHLRTGSALLADPRQVPQLPGASCAVAAALALLFAAACETPASESLTPAASEAPIALAVHPTGGPTPNRKIRIETGSFLAGTEPGTWDRIPELEPATFESKLGEFSIDQSLFPNDGNAPALLAQTQEEASRLCGERGGRLCTELEWERACRGSTGRVFASGNQLACEAPDCQTPEGVFNLGTAPEWTASFFGADSKLAGKPVVKGALRDEPASARRCARRASPGANVRKQTGFRCCYGAPNAAKVIEPRPGDPFTKHHISGQEFKELLRSDERTKELAEDLVFFSGAEAIRTVVSRGPGDKKGFDFTVEPLIWRPVAGAKFLVIVAKSGKDTSFVLAYHHLGENPPKLAASFVMRREPGPVVIAYSDSIRPRLHFSSCWGCPGETAKFLYRDPDRIVPLQP